MNECNEIYSLVGMIPCFVVREMQKKKNQTNKQTNK